MILLVVRRSAGRSTVTGSASRWMTGDCSNDELSIVVSFGGIDWVMGLELPSNVIGLNCISNGVTGIWSLRDGVLQSPPIILFFEGL